MPGRAAQPSASVPELLGLRAQPSTSELEVAGWAVQPLAPALERHQPTPLTDESRPGCNVAFTHNR